MYKTLFFILLLTIPSLQAETVLASSDDTPAAVTEGEGLDGIPGIPAPPSPPPTPPQQLKSLPQV